MKNKIIKLLVHHYDAAINFSSFLTASLIFISGIGRYRTILVYAIYSLAKSLLSNIKTEQKIKYPIFALATIFALYLDITNGPLLPIFTINYLIVAVPLMAILDTIMRRYAGRFIEILSEGRLFLVCPSCKYGQQDLMEKCKNCSYKKGNQILETVNKQTCGKIPPHVLSALRLNKDEEILFHMKASPPNYINGIRKLRNNLVITTKNIFFIELNTVFPFNIRYVKGWRDKDTIPLSEINSIEGKMKKIYITKQPFLVIKTASNDVYEIGFPYKRFKERINDIANIIKKGNPSIEVTIDLSENSLKTGYSL